MSTHTDPPTLGQFNEFEVYPMPMFATLSVADIAAVERWYQDALGFKTMFAGPSIGGKPSMVHLRRNRYQDLLIVAARATGASSPTTLTLSFSCDEVDTLASRARSVPAVGLSVVNDPIDTPWNTRDLRVTDPAGHVLIFTARQANPDPERVKQMQAMFDAARKPASGS